MRDVEEQSRGRGLVILVVAVLTCVPMLRVVPVVKGAVMVFGNLLRQEVQVLSLWTVGMEPCGHPTERLSEQQSRQQDEEEEQRPP